jgi:hypothetical protein
MDGQHLGAMSVSGELMRDHLFRTSRPGEWFRVEAGLPADAEFVRCYEDAVYNRFVFVYRHPSFPLHRPGEVIRFLDPPQVSALCLSVPLAPDTAEFLERLIAEQSRKAREKEEKAADVPHIGEGK